MERDLIEKIHREVSLLDLAARYGIELKRIGSQYRGFSPFKSETNPSFFIVPSRNFFKCFSTGLGGGPVKFVKLIENISTREAIYKIAEWYNIPINTRSIKQETTIYDLRHRIANFLSRYMLDSKNAGYMFLQKRFEYADEQMFKKVIQEHYIGYLNKDIFNDIKRVFDPSAFDQIGLSRNGHLIADNAIIIPVFSNKNKILTFLIRSLDENSDKKYFYSVEKKEVSISEIIYNYDNVLVQRFDTVYVVEGVLDVIAMRCINVNNVVALMGINLTDTKVSLLRKFSKVIFNLDSDVPGHHAFVRYATKLISGNVFVYYISNKPYKDPDEAIRNGIYNSQNIKEKEIFIVDLVFNGKYNDPMVEYRYKKWLKSCISKITDKDVRSIYYQVLQSYYKKPSAKAYWNIDDLFFYYMIHVWRFGDEKMIKECKINMILYVFHDAYREAIRANFLVSRESLFDYEYMNMMRYVPETLKKLSIDSINRKIKEEYQKLLSHVS